MSVAAAKDTVTVVETVQARAETPVHSGAVADPASISTKTETVHLSDGQELGPVTVYVTRTSPGEVVTVVVTVRGLDNPATVTVAERHGGGSRRPDHSGCD